MKMLVRGMLLCLCIGLLVISTAIAQDEAVITEYDNGWIAISPGGDTMCADGSPYTFFTREGESDNLWIDFQGGGACWNGFTCPYTQGTYDSTVNPEEPNDNPAIAQSGLYNLSNPDNPLADHDIVFVPYCTADVHMGDTVQRYQTLYSDIDVHHNGVNNATAALSYAYENYAEPESVFISGCSAGSLGAEFWSSAIMSQYEGVRAAVFADSAGGYRGDLSLQFTQWGTIEAIANALPALEGFEGLTPETLSFETFVSVPMAAFPDNVFTRYNTIADEVQISFIGLSRTGFGYDEALPANLQELVDSGDNFASYTAWGSQHCIIPFDNFYEYQVNGVRLRDWVAALAAGEPVETVACEDCETPELFGGE